MPERWLVPVAPEPPRLGETLRRLRLKKQLNQRDVAAVLGIADSTVSQYEIDRAPAPADLLRQMAALYGVEAEDLFKIEAEYDLWKRMRVPLPGRGVALPADPEIVELFHLIKDWDAKDIYALAKSAQRQRTAPKARPAERELTDEDYDGHEHERTG
jgi:transcriptional regulator with XRE-family HTH domain